MLSRFVLDPELLTAYIHFTSFAMCARIYGQPPITPRIFVSEFNGNFSRLGFDPLAGHALGGYSCARGRQIRFACNI